MNKNDLRTVIISLLCSIIVVGFYHFGMGLCRMYEDDCPPPCGKPVFVYVVGTDAHQNCMRCRHFRGNRHGMNCGRQMMPCPMVQQQGCPMMQKQGCPMMQKQGCPMMQRQGFPQPNEKKSCGKGGVCPDHGMQQPPCPAGANAPQKEGAPAAEDGKKAAQEKKPAVSLGIKAIEEEDD